MLKPVPWANSIAAVAAVLYFVFWLISQVAPNLFETLFNAQFLGANVASLYGTQPFNEFLVSLVFITATAWIVGYLWSMLYNKWK